MNIVEAFKTGKKVRRQSWAEGEYVTRGEYADIILTPTLRNANFTVKDMLADDWEVVVETVPFEEALKAMKQGKSVRHKTHPEYFYIENGLMMSLHPEFGREIMTSLLPAMVMEDSWLVFD